MKESTKYDDRRIPDPTIELDISPVINLKGERVYIDENGQEWPFDDPRTWENMYTPLPKPPNR